MASARLIDQRIEQPALVGREQRAGLVAVDADDADGAAAGAHRQEQALRAGQRVRAAPGGAVVLPGPFRRGEIGLVEHVLRRIAGLDGDRAVLGQQQHDPHLQHQRGLVGRRPEHVVERADAGELAAERVERFGRARARHRGHRLRAAARGDIGDDDRHDREEDEGGDVGRIGDREGVDRRQEEEIVAERRGDAGEQRRPQAEAHGDADDRRQEHEIDVLDAEPGLDQLADAERRRRPRAAPRHRAADRRAAAPSAARTVFFGIGSPASSSPAMTWTLMLPERRTRSCTTEPCRISNQRERVDLPMTICVTLLACAKPMTSSAMPPVAARNA